MISNERDILPIGYGAMLVEGFVSLLALIAACTLHQGDYFAINANPALFPDFANHTKDLAILTREVGENTLVGRTGGAVTLAVGMAKVFSGLPGMKSLMSYWYHFAIMFEALFILTTIDTGTRVARFILQEMLSPIYKPLGKGTWLPGVIITSFLVTFCWYYLLKGGTISTIWPMFGIANQLLSVIALAIGTTCILKRASKKVYALTTFLPFVYMAVTVMTSGVQYTTQMLQPAPNGDILKASLTIIMMVLAVIISFDCITKWVRILGGHSGPDDEHKPDRDLMRLAEGTEVAE